MLPAIRTAHLLPVVDAKLIDLLRSLTAREWSAPTVAPAWTVKEVAAHLLDTQQRLVSRLRCEPLPAPPIDSDADLVAFINRLNAAGVARYGRLEPEELIAQLEDGSPLYAAHHQSLDPQAEAPYAVVLGGRDAIGELVSYRARADRTVASPAADPAGRRKARHHDARAVSPGARLFHARAAVRLSRPDARVGHGGARHGGRRNAAARGICLARPTAGS